VRLVVVLMVGSLCATAGCDAGGRQESHDAARAVPAQSDPVRELTRADTTEIYELLLRKLIVSEGKAVATYYFAWDLREDGAWVDPPAGFIDRFADLPVAVRPVSEAGLPNNFDQSMQDLVLWDREARRAALACRVEIYERTAPAELKARVVFFQSPPGTDIDFWRLGAREGRWIILQHIARAQ
jgi:hypothetical protein